ncbi:hypothetical protein JOD82_001894 [Paenibacillus sp. 1182]|uniref:hypothetical protein n=1 Tax=Paenibacillus sp. 1182 TaxID=2806565 RepID=UPI001B44AD0A|nr:hypothetical protein [Paenibacillus sp. 1182]MBP1308874.1 hypothetical protein [Paenibacillus sp. 1182]
MARGWEGLEIGDKVKYETSENRFVEGEVIHLYVSDKSRARIKTAEGKERDVICEYCEKV